MNENNITFNDTKIKKRNFYKTKRLFKIGYIDADKILISNKERYRKKVHLNTLLLMKIMIILVLYV